jgi:hypothetical protein
MCRRMAKKKAAKAPKPPEKPQGERFKEFAREHGADDPDALDRAFKNMAPPKKP